MSRYDFQRLNDKDFEYLAVDLLSKIERIHIERFKSGKDAGVDGRFFSPSDGEVIIQCKHWQKSGLTSLITHLVGSELPKIRKLNPKRYLLVTTVSLSRQNKKAIVAALSPFIISESDVIGQEDIEDLISCNLDIETRHYKLWLASTNVISNMFNNAVIGRSRNRIKDILEFSSRYVFTKNHDLAFEKLQKNHVIIITGEARIGKTTLADQMCLYYIQKEFQFVCLEDKIEEAEAVYSEGTKQVFYFDDFLGRNYLEALARNEDSKIIRFIKRVSKDSKKRFILTSRTTILNQGKTLSDQFHIENVERNEYDVRLTLLNAFDKAKILYNHLWFSSLSPEFIEEIYSENRFLSVIKHRNFNPRVISFLTDPYKLREIAVDSYWNYIQESLALPVDIWSNVFNNQLDNFSRILVHFTVYNGRQVSEDELRRAFGYYLNEFSATILPASVSDFEKQVRLVVGAVLNRVHDPRKGTVHFELFNPSVGDYVLSNLKKTGSDIGPYLRALRTKSSLDNLDNLCKSAYIGMSRYREFLCSILSAIGETSVKAIGYDFLLFRKLIESGVEPEKYENTCKAYIRGMNWGCLSLIECSDLLEVLKWYCYAIFDVGELERVVDLLLLFLDEPLTHDDYVNVSAFAVNTKIY